MSRVWKFGDNISTDAIIPGRRNITTDPKQLAGYAFEHARPEFSEEVGEGDVIVAGHNFGCGSSREHAVLAIKYSGIKYIIAISFAEIFYRNCVNNGVFPLTCGEDMSCINDGASVDIDLERSRLLASNQEYKLNPLPKFLREIINSGGLVPYLNEHRTYQITR